jgi:methylated-DNA-[protein]-cysteine S-methyltransferase
MPINRLSFVVPARQDGAMPWTLVPSPVDDLLIVTDEHGLCTVGFGGEDAGVRDDAADPLLRLVSEQLVAYFAGALTEFDLPLSIRRGSEFERAVWAQLARIPYGETRTYGQIAAAVDAALTGRMDAAGGAARAVGVACNRNPLPVVVPCHRVVGAGSKLVGFGGGLPRKRFLLELEARVDFERALS